MVQPWAFAGKISALDQSGGLVTLFEGSTFCLSDRAGDLVGGLHGLFFLDARLLSRFVLLVDGAPLQQLTVAPDSPYGATFVSKGRPERGLVDSDLLLIRQRHVGQGLREDFELRNAGRRTVQVSLELVVAVDFAHIFEVKQARVRTDGQLPALLEDHALVFSDTRGDRRRQVRVSFTGSPVLEPDRAVWHLTLRPGARWKSCVGLTCALDDDEIRPRYSCGESIAEAEPNRRLQAWRSDIAQVSAEHAGWRRTLARTVADLGALRIFDPEHPQFPVVAAGAPWYMTLFGRDSLITSWMALLIQPDLAIGTLETLARLQGTRVDPSTEEQPGRILHEVRTSTRPGQALAEGDLYYGACDATPLFVMLLGELHRWGLYPERVRELLPAADRAISWLRTYGDPDGDGFVEYARSTAHGLRNQGWKDSADGIPFADGSMPEPPIALCEVQGYTYAAYLARAELADAYGDPAVAADCRERARSLRAAFNRHFWLPDRGWYALALDGAKRPVDALASNMGHCLWTGIVDEEHAAAVADHLLSPAMFGGWGVRTLATTMAAYNPLSYHDGSVWPHDNAILVAGLARYGFLEHAHRITTAILAAADELDGRLPELFAGIGRAEVSVPVAYPSSCTPQAWAAAAPLLMLRSLLRLDPDVPAGRVHLAPALPPGTGPLRLQGVRIGSARVDVDVPAEGPARLSGLPHALSQVSAPARH